MANFKEKLFYYINQGKLIRYNPPPPGGSLRSTGHFVVEHALVIVPCPSVTLKWLHKCCISSNYVCDKFNIGIMYTSENEEMCIEFLLFASP